MVSDYWSGNARLKDVKHDQRAISETPTHQVLAGLWSEAHLWALVQYAHARGWPMLTAIIVNE